MERGRDKEKGGRVKEREGRGGETKERHKEKGEEQSPARTPQTRCSEVALLTWYT